ncbi:MAG TPA: hypothetical protein DCM87_14980 [Planctomycetes bacterium]|nr:hypothetical protein [Planctomycetota bacterium]
MLIAGTFLRSADEGQGGDAPKDEPPPPQGIEKLVERFEREKSLSPDKRLEAIEEFKIYQTPECVKFLLKIMPGETDMTLLRAIIIDLAVLGTAESVRAAVADGLPRLAPLVQISPERDPLVPRIWTYRAGKDYRMLPDFYFAEISGALTAVTDAKAKDWLVTRGLEGPIAKDPLFTQFMLGVIAQVVHPNRAKALGDFLRKTKDVQLMGAAIDAARLARLPDADFTGLVVKLLKHRDQEIQIASVLFLEKAAIDELKKELPKLLKNASAEMRMLAVDCVQESKLDVALITPLLGDKDWRVRATAVRAVGRAATADAVTALVKRLGTEDHPRIVDDIADVLTRLTGEDLGRQFPAWDGWWKANKSKAVLKWRDASELGTLKTRRPTKARTTSYYGLDVSNFACFLLDVSKSMQEQYEGETVTAGKGPRTDVKDKSGRKTERKQKIEFARENLMNALSQLAPHVRYNIITFTHEARAWRDGLQENSDELRAEAFEFLDEQQPRGSTNICDALLLAFSDPEVDTIYLLSDGAPTSGNITDPARMLEEIRRINLFRKVKINTIGFNLKGEAEDLMRNLADENYGAFVAK